MMTLRTITAAGSLALVLASAVPAQENSASAYEPKSLPGKLVSNFGFYPDKAKRLGITGRICLAYSVDSKGTAQKIVILESAGPDLDDRAKKMLADYHFEVPSEWISTGGID